MGDWTAKAFEANPNNTFGDIVKASAKESLGRNAPALDAAIEVGPEGVMHAFETAAKEGPGAAMRELGFPIPGPLANGFDSLARKVNEWGNKVDPTDKARVRSLQARAKQMAAGRSTKVRRSLDEHCRRIGLPQEVSTVIRRTVDPATTAIEKVWEVTLVEQVRQALGAGGMLASWLASGPMQRRGKVLADKTLLDPYITLLKKVCYDVKRGAIRPIDALGALRHHRNWTDAGLMRAAIARLQTPWGLTAEYNIIAEDEPGDGQITLWSQLPPGSALHSNMAPRRWELPPGVDLDPDDIFFAAVERKGPFSGAVWQSPGPGKRWVYVDDFTSHDVPGFVKDELAADARREAAPRNRSNAALVVIGGIILKKMGLI